MKGFTRNSAIAIFIAAATVTAGIFYFKNAGGDDPVSSSVNPAFGEYISSYTGGVISSGSVLRIVMANEVVDSTALGETTVKLFDFSPSMNGTTVWVDRRTLEFRPASRWISGKVYEVDFEISKLIEVSGDMKTFEYTFQVIPQNFELSIENVRPYSKTELKRQKVEGMILTADFAEDAAVEKCLTAQQSGKPLTINWSHAGEGKQHHFVIEDVVRGEAASKVILSAKGTELGVEQSFDQDVEIPSLGDFKVTNVKVEQGGNQTIVLQFSDPLREKQNLSGLITLADAGSLDFEIRENEIRVFPPLRQTGSKVLTISPGIRNVVDFRMSDGATFDVLFEQLLPAVRYVGEGNILPSTDGLVLPFEAVNLKAVDIQVVKIFETNVLQFLQVNEISEGYELQRVGRPLVNKKVSLENSGVADFSRWNRYTLDLADYIRTEPGAIYRIRIGFKKAYSTYSTLR